MFQQTFLSWLKLNYLSIKLTKLLGFILFELSNLVITFIFYSHYLDFSKA
jgi:hypothetical protein